MFPYPGTLVFLKNACSRPRERLFFSKMTVPVSRNACFFKKWLFPHPGTLVFFKNGCSASAERIFFSKTVVPHLQNVYFSQKWLFLHPGIQSGGSDSRFPNAILRGEWLSMHPRGGFREKTICRAEQGSVLPGKLFVVSKNDFIPVLTAVRA